MKHTPGPWVVDSAGNIYGTEGLIRPFVGYVGDDHNDEQTKANASLISAAPELLSALRKLSSVLSDDPEDYADAAQARQVLDAVQSAQAAINKATI